MKIVLPEFKQHMLYDFTKLINALNNNIKKLKTGSEKKPNTFLEDIKFFRENWINNEEPVKLTLRQLRSISIHLLESKKTFKELIDVDLLLELLGMMVELESIGVKRRIVQLYFSYYLTLQELDVDIKPGIKHMLQSYKGKNEIFTQYKKFRHILFEPAKMLEYFNDIDYIVQKFNISPNSEYYTSLMLFEILKRLDKLENGKVDITLFEQIQKHRSYRYNEHLLIGEYVVRKLVEKMMKNTEANYTDWVNFIIDIAGDPRTVSHRSVHNVTWSRIGDKYKEYLVGYLSREDLVLFLEALSHPDHDEIYRYRKAFWKPFSKYIVNAKLFISQHEYYNLDHRFKKRFNGSNQAYSFISDSKRSFIYMDFGNIKVIEGTHNAKVRIYIDTPIELGKSNYDYFDFYRSTKARELIIEEITHRASEAGIWQNKVFNVLKQYIPNMDITLKETLL